MATLTSCEKFLAVEPEKSIYSKDIVFSNDVTATSATTGIYGYLYANDVFAAGSVNGFTAIAGLSADELHYNAETIEKLTIETNEIRSQNYLIGMLWSSAYKTIYATNSAIEGIDASAALSSSTKDKLSGECLFLRAFAYFYLVNMFGDVPILLDTDYEKNAKASRQPVSKVYEQILADLTKARELLPITYPSANRVRVNRRAAEALLARVHLYLGHWEDAESYASMLIGDAAYSLPSLDKVFLSDSREAIWQLMPEGLYVNTSEGDAFLLQTSPFWEDQPYTVTASLMNDFETGDKRLAEWTGTLVNPDGTFDYPAKYKVFTGGSASNPPVPLTEYSMVFRLAEQYLIRAEALAHQNKLTDAVRDVDSIRRRADLPLLKDTHPGISQAALLLVIEHERRIEFLAEWGHRWLDLKRTGRATILLGYKTGWAATDELYPIPESERLKNYYLGNQNPGYE